MKITPVDRYNRIFHIEDIFPKELLDTVIALDWSNMDWKRGDAQENWLRRHIECDANPALQTVVNYIWDSITEISNICGVAFTNPYPPTWWWYDEPGFDVGIHTDGHLPATMQLFWIALDDSYATTFYNSKNPSDPMTNLRFIPNSGYIMLNQPNADGSQPLQWHGMLNKVPIDTFRLTSYTTLGTYENK